MDPAKAEAASLEEIKRSIELLEALVADPTLTTGLSEEERIRLMSAAGRLSRPAKLERIAVARTVRKERRKRALKADRSARASTGIRKVRQEQVFVAPAPALPAPDAAAPRFSKSQNCYVCKQPYVRLHHFYDGMCPDCAEFNYAKRFQTVDLSGRTAYITGARLKIGYQAALKMLRSGARVVVSTRFPHDAATRYASEPDFKDWSGRLRIHGLDLRHSPSVEIFSRYLAQTEDRLDVLISNAAQTVRRPVAFYAHMLEREALPWTGLSSAEQSLLAGHYECRAALTAGPAADVKALTSWDGGATGLGIRESAKLSQIRMTYDDRTAGREAFPDGKLDADLQQIDLRKINTWRLGLAEVSTPELLEVMLINAVAPFILAAKLKPLMLRRRTGESHIVNVSAMEGIFSRGTKTDKHPHTNMAKAALNMMTLTSAPDYARDGIWMNAVDTGWVTDEDPAHHSKRKQELHDFQPPLDIVDGAARILDPLISGLLSGVHLHGKFFKDYRPSTW
jgi:NAD(P)-dependent dehydrogenase (short-subunit alcohol dehydrogenase family)